jgi:hypothetical protein
MTVLTGLGALVAFACLLPLGARLLGRRRAAAVAARLGLRPAPRRAARTAAVAAAIVLLGLAAAQPALTHSSHARVRTGVQALFVLDTSRSMAAAATPTSPTRLDRAVDAATTLRAAIPDVPSGIATLTDRVLPDLLPVADPGSFDAVAERSVAIEQPPPSSTGVRATTYGALDELAVGNYFAPKTARKLVVLLTDGESGPIDPGEIAGNLDPADGYRFVALRLWRGGESVFGANGKPEAAYRPDPAGAVVLRDLARALGGHAYDEGSLGDAAAALRAAAGTGPTTAAPEATTRRTPLAPYLAGLALLLLLAAVVPWSTVGRRLHWFPRAEVKATPARRRSRGRRIARVGGDALRRS